MSQTEPPSASESRVPLSNRRGTSPFFGVDRISVSSVVGGFESDPTAWNSVTVTNPGTPLAASRMGATVKLNDHCTVFVGVQEVPQTGETWCKIELNPSRTGDPEGHSLADPASVAGAVQQATDAASSLLVPAVPHVGAMKVRRLDVARDFEDVERPEYLVRGLGPVHRPWARRNLVHYDPARKGAQTLMVGSGAGVVRLYDKNAETEGATPGVLRWEAECRRDWVQKYGGVSTLDDVTVETVEQLGRDRWEWSAMGVEVDSMEAVVEKIMRSDLSFTEQRNLIGYLSMVAVGADVRAANSTHAKYRRAARELGVSLDPESLSGDGGFSARLDLDSGRMVCHVG